MILYTIRDIRPQINEILNVFVIYNNTNNNLWIQGYKQKTGKQSLDFIKIKRVDQKYDNNIKQIFLVLVDNLSVHRPNKVKETLIRFHPRIHLVFLPTRSPELNLIEVRWI